MRVLLASFLVLAACSGSAESPARERQRPQPAQPSLPSAPGLPPAPELPPSELPAPPRLIAIGDVHGDLDAFRRALRLGGAIDEQDRWIGGALWAVQTGDVLDRGDDEDDILALITRLEREASAAGGRLVALNGNHELMNAAGDFRYVTPEGFSDFAEHAAHARSNQGRLLPNVMRGRAAAFAPGGPYARQLAARATAVRVGDTVFVHGGITERNAERGLDAINRDVRAYLLGEAPLSPWMSAPDAPVWFRGFATDESPESCASLERVLATLHAGRMVVGHTVQDAGVTSGCDGRAWRIDVGLAEHYGGPLEILEIAGDEVRVLRGDR